MIFFGLVPLCGVGEMWISKEEVRVR